MEKLKLLGKKRRFIISGKESTIIIIFSLVKLIITLKIKRLDQFLLLLVLVLYYNFTETLSLKSIYTCVCVCVYLIFIYFWLCRALVVACRIFKAVCGLLSSCGLWAQEPQSTWDLSFPATDQTHIPYIRRRIFIHWTIRESLKRILF